MTTFTSITSYQPIIQQQYSINFIITVINSSIYDYNGQKMNIKWNVVIM